MKQRRRKYSKHRHDRERQRAVEAELNRPLTPAEIADLDAEIEEAMYPAGGDVEDPTANTCRHHPKERQPRVTRSTHAQVLGSLTPIMRRGPFSLVWVNPREPVVIPEGDEDIGEPVED